jgi:ParB family transcriptional regulator, chromosome partitioning protein
MDSGRGREAARAAVPFHDGATSAEAAMPRGIWQPMSAKEQVLKVISTDLLRSGTGSRSSEIGEDESMSELVASIASVGIIEPIVVREVQPDGFVVVAGQRRFAAAKLLNLRQVPCVVTQCSDSEALIISLTENLQRSDLNPIEKACALRRLLDEFALTQQEIGKRVGMSQSSIAHHMRLLSLPRQVQRLISEGALSVGHGKVLAGIADEHEAIDAALDCISKNKSVREFEAWLSSMRGEAETRSSRESLRKKREERELRNGLFLVIKECSEKTGSGTIEIPFDSSEEKEWVLRALSGNGSRQGTPIEAKPSADVGAKTWRLVTTPKPSPVAPGALRRDATSISTFGTFDS